MKYWSREDTKAWINQLQERIDDISEYLEKTLDWCDENYIEDQKIVFMCTFLTCIWVSQLRDEPITYVELMEMLGVEFELQDEEKFFELDAEYAGLTHKELLVRAVRKMEDDGFN